MLLSISTETIGILGVVLFLSGFALSLIFSLFNNVYMSRIFEKITYAIYALPSIGIFLIVVFFGRLSYENNMEKIQNREYKDVIEVYDGPDKIKEYNGEILKFNICRDYYYIKLEKRNKEVIEIREPKEYTIIKKEF